MATVAPVKVRWVVLGVLVVLLVVPALAITVARLLEPPAGIWVRLIFFTPYATLLYTAALLLLLLAWARGRGRWRGLARVMALGCLAGAVLHGVLAAPAYLGRGPEPSGNGDLLRVMSLNLLYGQADPARVVELAVANRIDVLVVQETDQMVLNGMRAAGLDQAFPHSAGEAQPGPAGTMVFSTLPISQVTRLGTAFGGYQMQVDDEITLLAVHARAPVENSAAWREDMRVLRRAAVDNGTPAVIAGDFNATTDHRELRELIGRGFDDAATVSKSRWQPTFPEGSEISLVGIPVPPLWAIDHVLVNGGLRPVATDTTSVEGTDHRALIAILER